jgi:hypothetical protein
MTSCAHASLEDQRKALDRWADLLAWLAALLY